jgi:lipopolysaccharide transport system permease protein
MLSIYTFVFSVVFKARWGVATQTESESKAMFAIVLFIGLIVHSLFSEIIGRAPTLIIGNVNYVKKVVFPLEILPLIATGAALFHTMVSIVVWLLAYTIFIGLPHWTIIFLPLIFLPMLLLALGFSWFLASLGVFLRDVGQTVTILITVLMFTAPVFFPLSSLPSFMQPICMFNPITLIITEARAVSIFGQLPNGFGLLVYTACALLICWAGFAWFQKTRKGFADVL